MKDDQQNYWQPQDEAEAPQQAPQATEPQPPIAPQQEQEVVQAPADSQSSTPDVAPIPAEVNWEASETIENTRGPLWFLGFGVIVLMLIGAMIYFREWIFAALVVVMAVAVVVMARRPARVMKYVLNSAGLRIDEKMHYYSEFRAFGVVRDGSFFAIKLIPAKRFSPEVMVYFSERDGETIVDILGSFLPMEDMELDFADKIIRKIRL